MFLDVSHVPSPTDIVSELYVLLPGGASCAEGDITKADTGDSRISYLKKTLIRSLTETLWLQLDSGPLKSN